MAEYFDRDAIYKAFANAGTDVLERASEIEYIAGFSYELVIEILDNIPTVDVAPVVYGQWVKHYRSGTTVADGYVSTCCDMWNARKSNYCPNCGAKMDGGANNG